jgi:hypothetical protein
MVESGKFCFCSGEERSYVLALFEVKFYINDGRAILWHNFDDK